MDVIYSLILYFSLFVSLFFEVFLLITYLEVKGEIEEEKKAPEPKFLLDTTIIVPCFNEEKTVQATVESLFNLDYPQEKLNFILVDDGSTDSTLLELKKFDKYINVKVLSKENGGKHTAVNLALEYVETELVGCLDADSFVTPQALKAIVRHFENSEVMAVTPSIKVHEPKNFLQYIQTTEYKWSIFLRRMLGSLGALYVTPGPFSIFRVEVFQKLGKYRYAYMTEDMEMAMRMQKNHYKIVNSHSAHVYTVALNTLKSLIKQRSRWSYGFLNNAIDYKELFFNRKYGHFGMFIMPIATLSLLTSLILVSRVIFSFGNSAIKYFNRYQVVGGNWKFSLPSFDWYFINTGVLPLVVITALALTLVILYLSIKLSDGKFRFSQGLFYYLFLYAFMTPLWLVKALIDTIFRRKVSWR